MKDKFGSKRKQLGYVMKVTNLRSDFTGHMENHPKMDRSLNLNGEKYGSKDGKLMTYIRIFPNIAT